MFLRVAILHRFYCAMAPMNFSQLSGVISIPFVDLDQKSKKKCYAYITLSRFEYVFSHFILTDNEYLLMVIQNPCD